MFSFKKTRSFQILSTKLLHLHILLIAALFSVSANQQMPLYTAEQQRDKPQPADINTPNVNFLETARKLFVEGNTNTIAANVDEFIESVPYFQASIPMRIFECLRSFSVVRCTKLFALQKMEENNHFNSSGNLTKDFLNQFFGEEEHMGSLVGGNLANISDNELNQRLMRNFQRFFKKRGIQLQFLPGVRMKVEASRENKITLSVKRQQSTGSTFTGRSSGKREETAESLNFFNDDTEGIDDEEDEDDDAEATKKHGDSNSKIGGGGKRKKIKNKRHSYKDTMIQMAVPVMIMPAILMASFLPFVLPVLKMATFMSMLMNNSAFIAALIYAARTHINSQDETPQHISYGYQGYH